MEVLDVLARCGGVADARTLVAFSSRRKLSAAVAPGQVVRDGRGRYALPTADEARRAAHRLTALVSGLSAATAHGWEVKWPPIRPQLTVPASAASQRLAVTVSTCAGGTCRTTTSGTASCALADSALRHGAVTAAGLVRHAERVRTTGRSAALRVAREASALAANPFESVLRAIALDVPGLDLRPQVAVSEAGWTGRPDLVDRERRIVVEAESFEFHGRRAALRHDCERYTALVLLGWRVVRFAWEHVMFAPEYVAGCLRVLADPARRTDGQVTLPRPALVRP